MRHNQGTMIVTDTERVQLAKQRHEANEQHLRKLQGQRASIACTKKRCCWIAPPPHDPCDACRDAGWLLFSLLLARDKVKVSAAYLRRAMKRKAGK
jgi:hypothetical protein